MTRWFKNRRPEATAASLAAARCADSADPYALEPLEPRLLLAADLGGGLDVAAALDRDEPIVGEVFDELSTEGRFGNLQNQLSPLAGAIRQGIDNETAEPLNLTELGGLLGTSSDTAAGDTGAVPKTQGDTSEAIVSGDRESAGARTELVFIDAGVDNHEQLLADLDLQTTPDRQIEVHLLDAAHDGVEQVAAILSGYQDLDAVHIL